MGVSLCQGLGEQKCVANCPVEALNLTKENIVVWDNEKCNRCHDAVRNANLHGAS
jgi:dissimilatory sulfite reductase (desulfoviridin) alpha/beta subunit